MEKNMMAAIFEGEGILTLKRVPVPTLKKPTQLLLKVEAASICGSDLHGLAVPPGQYMKPGIIYGHEFCGIIQELGADVSGFHVGERVAVNPRVRCGRCYECTHNKGDLCSNSYHYGQTGNGGFAQYALVDMGQIYHVPEGISPDLAAQTEPLSCVMAAVSQARATPVDHVLLYGAGPIGLTFIRVLKTFGINNLIVTAKGEKRVREAKACGADVVVDVERESVKNVMHRCWPDQADVIIDAVGRGDVFTEGIHLLNSQGRIVLFGLDTNAVSHIPPSVLVLNELSVKGVLAKDFPGALEMLGKKELQLERIITHRLPLEEIHTGIDLVRRKEACRVIIYPNGPAD